MPQAHDMISASGSPASHALAEFTRDIAFELATGTAELPSFPEVALRVREALADESIAIDDVVRLVSAEPSLAVRLLQLANSVALNPGAQRITTLRSAIARIGFNLARSATIAFAMSQMRRAQAWRGLEVRFREIWEASARLAAMSYTIARHAGRIDADLAMFAGMLHAVGRLFVLTRVSRFPTLLGDEVLYAEIETVWHSRAARTLLARWELAPEVLDAACDFDQAHGAHAEAATLSDVLLAARYLVNVRQPSDLANATFLNSPAYARLGIEASDALQLLTHAAAEIASLRAALAD
jgi:HD-like signal output (HDOD) protein